MIYRGFTQEYEISVAHSYGYEPNRAVGLPPPPPYSPRPFSDEWFAEQRKRQPRPENQRPTLAPKRDPDAPPRPRAPRKPRAKAVEQEAA